MTREEFHRIKEVSAAALEQPESERLDYVARACTGDETLEREVRSLLASVETASELFETPPSFDASLAVALTTTVGPGTRIGPYRILRAIGQGGMGAVFLAERADDEYRQRVALKIASDARPRPVLKWFRDERQILATLSHPNIARLMDGGTTADGLPYLVMEYVDGTPVDTYCTENHLDVRQRLMLFRQICSAVDVAHRHLIVHRDLKPRNILVADGTPKLLDFGIAKLLDVTQDPSAPGAGSTTGPPMLTPEYASPEQVQGGIVTTATDVYALGVLLYRLLTDQSPYHLTSDTPFGLAAAICDQDPERPSAVVRTRALKKLLAGDLDTIVLKALKKDPADRYASAAAIADDVDRYLTGLPLTARPDTLRYRAAKFLHRHKIAAAAATLILLSLIGGLGATLWQARQTELQRARAQRHFDEVRQLASSLIFEVHDGIQDLPGATPMRQLLVSRARDYFDSLAAEETDNVQLQRELAAAYDKLGSVLGRPYQSNVGDSGAALASYRKALAIREAAARAAPSDRRLQLDLWSSYYNVGNLLRETADTSGALSLHQRAHNVANALLRAAPGDATFMRATAQTALTRAHTFLQNGQVEQSLASAHEALALGQRLAAIDPSNRAVTVDITTGHGRIAMALLKLGRPKEALPHVQERVRLTTELRDAEPTNVTARRGLSIALLQSAQVLARLDDHAAAARSQDAALELRQGLADQDPDDRQARVDVMVAQLEIGDLLVRERDFDKAVGRLRPAVALAEALVQADPRYVYYQLSLMTALTRLAQALTARGHVAEAEPLLIRAVKLGETASAADRADARLRFELALAYAGMGDVVSTPGRRTLADPEHGAARWWYERGLAIMFGLQKDGKLAGGTVNGDEPALMAALETKLRSMSERPVQ